MPNPQVVLSRAAPGRFVPKSSWHGHRHRTNSSFRLTSAAQPVHLYWVCEGTRKFSTCSAHADKWLTGENASLPNVELEARIRKHLERIEVSLSSYDTAWVAMVPLPGSPQVPCFPQCVEWILKKQHANGSWGLSQIESSADKDILSSTLACVIALRKWKVGPEHVRRGVNFLAKNFSVVMDEHTGAPVGFNITFPGMLSLATKMGLDFPVRQTDVDCIFHLREMELKRHTGDKCFGGEAYMAYVAEGLGNHLDWNKVMKFQRKNGSLFNSPSATAAALIHNYDDKAFRYLNLLLSKFRSAVPTVYPLNIYCQLLMVDSLEKIGISRLFSSEIKSILDSTYIFWLQKDEEIMLDITTCAMAFRILRLNGYDVSPDQLHHVAEASNFRNSLQGYLNDIKSLLELYKASKVTVSENEFILDNIGYWSGRLLKEILCSDKVQRTEIFGEVEYALQYPFYATMERLDHRWNIEHFDTKSSHMLKTEYLPCPVNQEILALAIEDFNVSQYIYQDELQQLDSWLKENRLDQLQYSRPTLTYCYLSAAAAIFPPELSDLRIAWCKSCTLTAVVDDLIDIGGSIEEHENLIALVEKWDEHHKEEFYSEQVKIIFFALYTTVKQLAAMASVVQNRDVTKHLIKTWLDLMRSELLEAIWKRRQYVPTMEEYMTNGFVSFALGPIVPPALYFVGENISEHVVKDQEYNELFRLMSTVGRLLNDVQGFENDYEGIEQKLNSVSLLVLHSGGSMSIEEAKREIWKSIETCRRDLLRLVLGTETVVPRPCKELFWKMCKICYVYYARTNGFRSPGEMDRAVNAVIYEPLKLPR